MKSHLTTQVSILSQIYQQFDTNLIIQYQEYPQIKDLTTQVSMASSPSTLTTGAVRLCLSEGSWDFKKYVTYDNFLISIFVFSYFDNRGSLAVPKRRLLGMASI